MDHGSRGTHLTVTPSALRRLFLASLIPLLVLVPPVRTGAAPVSGLTEAETAVLESRGYVVVAGDMDDFASAYARITELDLPSFITADSVLWLSDSLFDDVQRTVEEEFLAERLTELSEEMVRLTEEQYLLATDPIVKEAARLNLAYFSVGLSLLDPDFFPSEFVRSLVERELALIEEARATALSPIMGATPLDGVLGPGEDYSAYEPVGHYNASDRMRGFYRALTWYSRMAFALPEGRVEDYTLTRQALLLVRALSGEGGIWYETWEQAHETLEFFHGDSGDPTVGDYLEMAEEVYGEEYELAAVAGETLLMEFVSRVSETAPPHFETHELRGLRFLPRPYYPDITYFDRLCAERREPSTVDIIALLGSHRARQILEDRDAFGSETYRQAYEEIELSVETMSYADWMDDLYWSWLYAVSAVARAPSAAVPPFMAEPGWRSKSLTTSAAAWALTRRVPDGALLMPLSGREAPGLDVEPPFIEPVPELYSRLKDLGQHIRDRLWEDYLLDDDLDDRLADYCVLMTSLERISRSVLAGGGMQGAGRGLGDHAGWIRMLTGGAPSGARGAGELPAFTAIPYSPGAEGPDLRVGLGRPDVVYIRVIEGGEPVVYAGAVFSFYELSPNDPPTSRTSDWTDLILDGRVERPEWTSDYLRE
ncbi:MAG: DUF3160 domain-containing protein [Candidatus Eisenbacteria bacterium]|nr:DUF3160 domain-containing protein [Candidatus Eisenbacteria bacterium]